RPARPGDVLARPEDLRRDRVLGRLLVRAVRPAHRLGRAQERVPVARRLRDRPRQLPADQLLPDQESQFLIKLLLVGISHRTAPVELRERVDFNVRGMSNALSALAGRGSAREAVIVSTCNRAEIYAACDDAPETRADLARFISEFTEVPPTDVAPHLKQ